MSDAGEDMEVVVDQLRRVATGLGLISIGLGVLILNGVAVVGVMMAFLEIKGSPAAMLHALYRDHAGVMMGLTALGVLSRLLTIAGKIYCVSVPLKSAATPLIVVATTASGIGAALSFAGQMPDLTEYADDLNGGGLVFTVVGYLFFLRFLGQLAKFLGSARQRMRTRQVLLGSASILGVGFVAGLSGNLGDQVVVVGILLASIGGLIVFAMYNLLVNDMRRLTLGAANHVAEREGLMES